MKKTVLSIVSIMALSSASYAGGGTEIAEIAVVEIPSVDTSAFYIGLGGASMGLFNTSTDEKITSLGVMLQAGYKYNDYIAIEGRYTLGVGKVDYKHGSTINADNSNLDTKFSNLGIYLKPMYPMGDFNVYGLLGYGNTRLTKIPAGATSADRGENGFQWGAGLDYEIIDDISIFVDYARVYDNKGFNSRALNSNINSVLISTGLSYKF